MRPSGLPGPDDVPEGTDLPACLLAAEILARAAILPRRMRAEVLLGGPRGHAVLDWHPVRRPTLDGAAPGRAWWSEPEFGLVGTSSLPASSYRVDFLVGYEEGSVPAIYAELARLVALAGAGEASAEQVFEVAAAARAMREPIERVRAGYRRT